MWIMVEILITIQGNNSSSGAFGDLEDGIGV